MGALSGGGQPAAFYSYADGRSSDRYRYNYAGWTENKDVYGMDHEKLPDRIMVGTESLPKMSFEEYQNVMERLVMSHRVVWW